MELVYMVAFTILAIIFGWVFVRKKSSLSCEEEDFREGGQTGSDGKKSNDDAKTVTGKSNVDPQVIQSVENCEGPLHVKEYVKYMRDNQLQEMTEEERKEEIRIQKEQLNNIFKMMQSSQEHLGINSMEEMEEQMKLYSSSSI